MAKKRYKVTRSAAWFVVGEIVYMSYKENDGYSFYKPTKPNKIGDRLRSGVEENKGWCLSDISCMEWDDTIKIGGKLL